MIAKENQFWMQLKATLKSWNARGCKENQFGVPWKSWNASDCKEKSIWDAIEELEST